MIFVFGSNVEGIHGAGAAKYAFEHHGAKWGVGYGHQGNSFAIPTKWTPYKRMDLETIEHFVSLFMAYVERHDKKQFQITPIGCGLAGYTPKDIAPMFLYAPPNCLLPTEFLEILTDENQR